MSEPLLRLEALRTQFRAPGGAVAAVDGVSLEVAAGETLALVGESGSGKSVTALSILRLVPEPDGRITGGRVWFRGRDLLALPPAEMRRVRGREIAMVFQEPMSSLNPVLTCGEQVAETLVLHERLGRAAARARSVELFRQMGIPDPEQRVHEYPHQLSGGTRQRVMIAMALACRPALVIADEPTTALDVTIQAQILELMKALQDEMGMSIILITHDLGVIAETCEDVLVMYAGRIAEVGSVEDIFHRPSHPYTRGLLESIPRLEYPRKSRLSTIEGMVPALMDLPAGCRFNNRCPHRSERCTLEAPALEAVAGSHRVSCHHWGRLPAWSEPVA